MQWAIVAFLVLLGLTLAAVVAGQLGLLHGAPPVDLGLREGRLKAPSLTPNSISSQAALWPGHPRGQEAQIAPLALLRGDGPATMLRLQAVVKAMPGAELVTFRDDYLYARFTTRLMKYTDDVELWFDPAARMVQVRSASRLGKSDLGANRARIEAIRAQLQAG